MGEKDKDKTEGQEQRETEEQESQQESQETKEKEEINLRESLDKVMVEKMALIVAEQVEYQLRSTIRGVAALVAAKLDCTIKIIFPDKRQKFGSGVSVKEIANPLPIVPFQDRIPVPIVPESLDHPYEEQLSEDMAKVESHTSLSEDRGAVLDRNKFAKMVGEKTVDNDFHGIVIQRREVPRGWKAECKTCGWDTYFQTEEMITWFYGIAHQVGAYYEKKYGDSFLQDVFGRVRLSLQSKHIED